MSIYPEQTVKKVLKRLEIEPVLQLIDYRTDTIQAMGHAIKCFCPIHKESVFRTLIIDRESQRFTCSYSMCPGRKGGDLIELLAHSRKIDYDEALRLVVEEFQIEVELPPPAEYIERTLEIAENYLELSVLDEAESEFLKIDRAQGDNPQVQAGLAEIYRQRGDSEKLRPRLEMLLGLQVKEEDWQSALATAQELQKLQPEDPALRERTAECLLGLEREDEALEELMQVAGLYEEKNDIQAALGIYRRIRGLDTNGVDVTPHLIHDLVSAGESGEALQLAAAEARSCCERRLYDKALSYYKTALGIDAGRDDLRGEMLKAAYESGLSDQSLEDCLSQIDYYLRQDSPSKAIDIIEDLKALRPASRRLLEKEIEVLRHQGQEQRAAQSDLELIEKLMSEDKMVEAWRRVERVAARPELDPDALSRLAQAAYSLGNARLAVELLLKRIDSDLANRDLDQVLTTYDQLFKMSSQQPEFLIAPIQLLLEHNQPERAAQYSEKLIAYYAEREEWLPLSDALLQGLSIAPERLEWKELLARVYELMNQPERAVTHDLELARACMEREEWPRAQEAIERIRRCDPQHAEALALAGELHLKMGQRQKAFEEFKTLVVQHIEQQESEAARALVDRMREIESDPVETLHLEAELYKTMGETASLIETLQKLAALFIERKAYARAVECASAVLDYHPEDIETIRQLIAIFEATYKTENVVDMKLRLCEIYRQREESEKEIEIYRELHNEDANDCRIHRKLIEALLRTHRFDEAVAAALKMLDQFSHGKHLHEAIEVANQVLSYDADNIALQQRLTEIYKRQGENSKWVAQATQLINCYSRRNMNAEIAQLYEDLVQAQPENINFRVNLISAYEKLNKLDKARKEYLNLARHYLDQNNEEDAEATLKQALELNPEDEEILEQLAGLYDADQHAEKRASALKRLVEIHLQKGRDAEAVERLREIVELDPDDKEASEKLERLSETVRAAESQVRHRHEKSRELLEQGEVGQAIDELREAVNLRPDDTKIRRQLVKVLVDNERRDHALEELWTIVNQHNVNEQFSDVLRSLNEILRMDPRNVEARRMKAETYAKMGEEKLALEEFRKISGEPTTPPPNFSGPAMFDTPSSEDLSPFEPMPLMRDYTFEEFVVGDNSSFAVATCQAAAKAPAKHYNPVFIWSDVGLGKTHLINAIANYIEDHQPQLRLHYTSAEEYTGQLIDAISRNLLSSFRNYYKRVDVLLMDDIQFLAGKEKAQEEFFHIFNMLFQAKKQIVITCDRPPKDIAHLEKRLKSRFGAGVIVDIQPPDLETRMAILKNEAATYDCEIDSKVIQMLAERIHTNVRALKGAFNQIMAHHQLRGETIEDDLIERILAQVFEAV